jgi:hypothetical protein
MSQQPPEWDPDPSNPYAGLADSPPVHGPFHYPGQPRFVPPAWGADDPLVTPPGAGVGGWFDRVMKTFARSWRSVGTIILITQTLPGMIIVAAALALTAGLVPDPGTVLTQADVDERLRNLQALLPVLLVAIVVLLFVQAVGWGGATWAMTREAAGQPAPLGSALGFGLRRAPGLFGWYLVTALIIAVGILACILPGIYFVAATALVGPVYLFERSRPIGRSFRLLHDNFGPVLGRLLIIFAIFAGGQVFSGIVQNVGVLAASGGGASPVTLTAVFGALGVALALPFTILQTIALVLTYVEQRAQEIQISTPQLVTALD